RSTRAMGVLPVGGGAGTTLAGPDDPHDSPTPGVRARARRRCGPRQNGGPSPEDAASSWPAPADSPAGAPTVASSGSRDSSASWGAADAVAEDGVADWSADSPPHAASAPAVLPRARLPSPSPASAA